VSSNTTAISSTSSSSTQNEVSTWVFSCLLVTFLSSLLPVPDKFDLSAL
jgi:hypothetical protein